MRLARKVLVLAVLLAAFPPNQALAQRTTERSPPLRAAEEQAPNFQPRTPAARLETLRSLEGGQHVRPEQLMEPFSLTPRTPYIDGRGALSLRSANYVLPHEWLAGEVRFDDLMAEVQLHILSGPRRRYLIDCRLTSGVTVRAQAGSWESQTTSANMLASFYTPPISPGTTIRITDGDPQLVQPNPSPWGWTGQPPEPLYAGWRFYGCEITPVQAQ